MFDDRLFFRPFSTDVYLQFRRGWLSLTDLRSGQEVTSHSAITAPNGNIRMARFALPDELPRVVTAGRPPDGMASPVVDGFGHPRVIIGDFIAAQLAVRAAWEKVRPNQWTGIRRILVHLQEEDLEGGLTEVEKRAMRDLAVSTGARHVRLLLRPFRLTLEEALALLYGSESAASDLTI